ELENDAAFQQAVRTSHGRRPPITAKISSTAVTRPIATGYGVGFCKLKILRCFFSYDSSL
uniref:Uncharacterized protein n=1 Tax=Theropithecus gelada TaxID=9565 RepID=A0A8D2F2I8_THEGE